VLVAMAKNLLAMPVGFFKFISMNNSRTLKMNVNRRISNNRGILSRSRNLYGTFCFLVYKASHEGRNAAPPTNSKKLDKNRKVAETILRCRQD
jgi:hypothetical protein